MCSVIVSINSELEDGNPAKKYKGCYVVPGDRAVDKITLRRVFQELGMHPATLEASKAADFFS